MASVLDTTVALIDWNGYCGFSGDDPVLDAAEQNKYESLINSASQWIRDFCNRDLVQAPRTFYTNYNKKQLLPTYPVSQVTAVYYDPQRQWGPDTLLTAGLDYIVDTANGLLYYINDSSFNVSFPFWNTPFLKQYLDFPMIVRIDHISGYNCDTTQPNPMPWQLRQATFELVRWYAKRQSSDQIGVRVNVAEAMTTTFDLTPPLNIINMVLPYKDQYKRAD
jgi:hypothetical protein